MSRIYSSHCLSLASTLAAVITILVAANPLKSQAASTAITFDDFNVNNGHFTGNLYNSSGNDLNVASSSTVGRVTTDSPREGAAHQKLVINATTTGSAMRVRHLSGGGTPANNIAFTTSSGVDGWVGVYIKTLDASQDPNWTVQIWVEGAGGNNGGILKTIIADGAWHLYEWNLDDNSGGPDGWGSIPNIASGSAIVTDGSHTIDSVFLRNSAGPATTTLFMDFVAKSASGSVAGLLTDPCINVSGVLVSGPIATNSNQVIVSGVDASATAVTVYQTIGASTTQIGTLTSGIVAGNNSVTVTGLTKGAQVEATQTIGGQQSCIPTTGVIVGGGPNPSIRVSASIRQPGGLTGPIGANGGGPTATIYWIKATGSSGGAPLGGLVLNPSTNWQTIVFDPRTDPEFVWNAGTQTLPDVNQFGILEGLSFAMDDLTDTGPFEIYLDNLRNGTTLVQDFENNSAGPTVQFAKPGNSGTTSGALLTSPDSSQVTQANSAGGTNSEFITWQFNGLGANKWVRLNALANGGSTPTPNPELDLTKPFAIDVLILPKGQTAGHSLGLIALMDDQTNCPGDNVTWTVNATPGPNTGSYTYQWRLNGSSIPGATSSTFVTNTVSMASGGKYSVIVGDGSTAFVTNSATLTVLPIASISSQPSDQVVNLGDPANFSVSAGSVSPCVSSFTYQWRHDGTDIAGATDTSYSIATTQLSDWGRYSVLLSNQYGTVLSAAATLNVVAPDAVIGTGTGLLGDYYSNHVSSAAFNGPPAFSQVDPFVDYDWLDGAANGYVNTNLFAIRWSGKLQPEWAQTYTFYTRSDDGVRLWVNNQLLINSWVNQAATEHSATIALTTNLQDIVLEYFENTGNASVRLSWESASQMKAAIPQSQLYPATGSEQPALTASISNNNIVLTWGAGSYPVQWSTNVLGPYTNVINNAVSPLTIPIGPDAARYYRLQTRYQ